MTNLFLKLRKSEKGATAIEYGLIAALIAVVLVGTLTSVGGTLNQTFTDVDTALKSAPSP